MYPRELYCVHCGSGLQASREVLLLPQEGSRWSNLGAFALDVLGVALTTAMVFWKLPGLVTLSLGFLVSVLYRAWARFGGRQSFGQSVFFLLTVAQDATPPSFSLALRRSVGELWWLPLSVFSGAKALRELDRHSGTYEVRLV